MIPGLIAFIITFLLGPVMFFILSRKINIPKKLKKFPAGINDGVGDMFFLPWYNLVLFNLGFSFGMDLFFALSISFLAVLAYAYLDRKSDYVDWSKPKKNKYNFGGYYHLGFFMIQTTLIVYGLTIYFREFFLWIPLIAYFLTVLFQILMFDHW